MVERRSVFNSDAQSNGDTDPDPVADSHSDTER